MEESEALKLLPGVTVKRTADSFNIQKFERSYNLSPDNFKKFQLMVELLSKGVTKSELEKRLDDDLEEILKWMKNKRIIAASGDTETEEEKIIAAHSGYKNLEKVRELLENADVGVYGLENIGGIFNEHKIRSIKKLSSKQCDVLVVLSNDLNDLKEVNKTAVDSETPILHIRLQKNRLFIGPFVIPHTTACGNCMSKRINYDPDNVEAISCEIFDIETFKPLIKHELYRYLGKYQSPRTRDTVLEIDTTTFEIQNHSILKVPNCEHCGETKVFRG